MSQTPPQDFETRVYLEVNEATARDLLAGCVSDEVKAMCRCAIDWEFEVLAKAMARPVAKSKQRRRRTA